MCPFIVGMEAVVPLDVDWEKENDHWSGREHNIYSDTCVVWFAFTLVEGGEVSGLASAMVAR